MPLPPGPPPPSRPRAFSSANPPCQLLSLLPAAATAKRSAHPVSCAGAQPWGQPRGAAGARAGGHAGNGQHVRRGGEGGPRVSAGLYSQYAMNAGGGLIVLIVVLVCRRQILPASWPPLPDAQPATHWRLPPLCPPSLQRACARVQWRDCDRCAAARGAASGGGGRDWRPEQQLHTGRGPERGVRPWCRGNGGCRFLSKWGPRTSEKGSLVSPLPGHQWHRCPVAFLRTAPPAHPPAAATLSPTSPPRVCWRPPAATPAGP